ncbi:DUF4398 domain-containing protein [Pseudomonas sp. TTU2014-080ASC]|uniref:DUF4398 domain-containing protein n=1 Tax=Pseudomonas sp. TTU2014-080ASC TaxID=1729724 RepID=UPI0007187A82|nr:DUF4398 domain-containing protein [Pseudomonas sp. TTU2014-080ASC]KRW62055.1 hypothetical protein AO726_01125 [Pseudomonas sp. TTU2014-080ASC]
MSYRHLCVALLPLIFAGCASTDPEPVEQIRLTEQAISQAKSLGVSPDDSTNLRQAEEKFSLAQAAVTEGAFKEARTYAEQAELDARLAEAEHLTAKSKQQLTELRNGITRLRKQLGGLQ